MGGSDGVDAMQISMVCERMRDDGNGLGEVWEHGRGYKMSYTILYD